MTRKKLNQLEQRRDDLAEMYRTMGLLSKADRVRSCMEKVEYNNNSTNNHIIIDSAWFCGDRWCPICQWRNANTASYTMRNLNKSLIEETEVNFKYRMVTLTVPNVTGEELASTIEQMGAAWAKITRRAMFEKCVKGWVKVLDITFNPDAHTYHPHFHVATCHVSSYGKNPGYYITEQQWLDWWRTAMGNPSITQVVDGRWDSISHAVGYGLIPTNDDNTEIPVTKEVFETLLPAMRWKRRLSKGGIYRRIETAETNQ